MLVLTVIVGGAAAVAQKPGPSRLPPNAEPFLPCLGPWQSDYAPSPTIAPPTDLRANLEIDERPRVRLTWEDNADNETCYGVVKHIPAEALPLDSYDPASIILGAMPDSTSASDAGTFFAAGTYCYHIFAGSGYGRSAPSNTACVDVPAAAVAAPAPSPPPPSTEPRRPRHSGEVPTAGIPDVDAVIRAVLEFDADALAGLIEFTAVPCITEPRGIGAPPPCSSVGQAAGTVVEVIPFMALHADYITRGEAAATFRDWLEGDLAYYGVLKPTQPLNSFVPDKDGPLPGYGVAFRGPRRAQPGAADFDYVFYLLDGRIVGARTYVVGLTDLPASDDPSWLIPPES